MKKFSKILALLLDLVMVFSMAVTANLWLKKKTQLKKLV